MLREGQRSVLPKQYVIILSREERTSLHERERERGARTPRWNYVRNWIASSFSCTSPTRIFVCVFFHLPLYKVRMSNLNVLFQVQKADSPSPSPPRSSRVRSVKRQRRSVKCQISRNSWSMFPFPIVKSYPRGIYYSILFSNSIFVCMRELDIRRWLYDFSRVVA